MFSKQYRPKPFVQSCWLVIKEDDIQNDEDLKEALF